MTVRIVAPTEVSYGDIFEVAIEITQVTDLDIVLLKLEFDPAVLQVVPPVKKGELTSTVVEPAHNIHNEEGWLKAIFNLPGLTGVSGEGSVAVIEFEAIGFNGAVSKLELPEFQLGDIGAKPIPIGEIIPAQVQVIGGPPQSPYNLKATAISETGIGLTWQNNPGDKIGFIIEKRKLGKTFGELTRVAANATTYTDFNLESETTYCYQVKTYNAYGESRPSNESCATSLGSLAPPDNLSAAAVLSSQIRLNWRDNANNETGFKIERRKEGSNIRNQIGTVSANATTYLDSGLEPETTYYYQIRAYDQSRDSGYSNEASATTPGSFWSEVSSPTSTRLNSVSMVSPTDGWVVGGTWAGEGAAVGVLETAILHYDGSSWGEVSSPTSNGLSSVSMVSATDGWAVGESGTILHYNGTLWSTVSSPTSSWLYSVTMASATNGWAVGGYGTILHYDGSSWSEVSSPTSNYLYSVSMANATDGWAVGSYGTILHYNGSSWSTVSSPTSTWLNSVSMVSAMDGWAVGYEGPILHYDGSSWSTVTTSGWGWPLSVTMVSATDGWAVGYEGTILHYDGSSWSTVSSPTSDYLMSVTMVSATDGWAVGEGGTILRFVGEPDTTPNISVSLISHDFGSINVGSQSASQTFTISNTGDANLEIGAISLTGADSSEFNIQSDNCAGQTLAPADTCTVDVVFSPISAELKTANLSIPSNDPDTPTFEVPLSGEVITSTDSSSVLINEVAFKETNDWIEFYIRGTYLGGLRVYKGITMVKEFPDINANAGDYVLLHFGGDSANDENDTTGKGANGYWDIYTDNSGITGTDDIVRLQKPGTSSVSSTNTLDAVIWSNNDGNFTGSKSVANALVEAGHWDAGFDFNVEDSGAVIDSDDVVSGFSIGRDISSADNNSRNDWSILNQTEGAVNDTARNLPDLVVSSLTVTSWAPTSVNQSYSINYSYTITNIGTAPANLDGPTEENYDNISVQACLSADTIFFNEGDIAAGGTILGVSPLGELAPGNSFSGSFGCSVATIDPSVTPYLILMVDWGQRTAESDESNNTTATLIGDTDINDCYPDLPDPELIVTGSEDYEANGYAWTRFLLAVANSSEFPDELFDSAPHLPPCGLNTNSSRTWVDIYDDNDNRLYGFCGFPSAENLNSMWFAIPRGGTPPNSVYIKMIDRECNITYTSNLAPISNGSSIVTLFSDDFNDNSIDTVKWIYATGHRVAEENNIMKVETTVTDQPGVLNSKWMEIDPNGILTVTRRVLIHYDTPYYYMGENEFFLGYFRIQLEGASDLFGVNYCNYKYQMDKEGFFLMGNGHESDAITAVWDTWFDEKLAYNPNTGILEYYIDGVKKGEFNIGPPPELAVYKIRLYVQAYGWWTTHYQHFDNIAVTQSQTNLPVEILTTSLPNGQVGVSYSQTLTVTGGAPPDTWSKISGNLPDGLSLSPDGIISGTPTTEGTFIFTVTVQDSSNPAQTDTQELSITITVDDSIRLTNEAGDELQPDQSHDGEYIVMRSNMNGITNNIWRMDSSGENFVKLTDMPSHRSAWNSAVHPDGKYVYYMDNSPSGADFHWFCRTLIDDTGGREQILLIPGGDGGGRLSFSPDGSQFAYHHHGYDEKRVRFGRHDIKICNSDGSNLRSIFRNDNMSSWNNVAWSSDGTRIYFSMTSDDVISLYSIGIDGAGLTRLTNISLGNCSQPAVSPDGKKIIFQNKKDSEPDYELYIISSDGSGVTRLTDNDFNDVEPTWSYDGSRIIYSANADGDYDLYAVTIGDTSPPTLQITNLLPENNARLGSNDVTFTWQTSLAASSAVYLKKEGDASYSSYTGDDGLFHTVTV
ncbi:MAG: choice-of-anchor D domain-containing protein, partial [bacterium]|nr:choice-of-anchor D domain-containing protein [bacterium]